MPDYIPDNVRAQSSIKSLNFELSNLTPSSLITLFEIDLNKLIESKGIVLGMDALAMGLSEDVNDGILKFHNNIKIFNSFIIWQGKKYYPVPINSEGFESTTKGTLPQPSLSIASQSETGTDQLALLKNEMKKFGDIIGSKVTRRRTFAKYLDKINFTVEGILSPGSSITLPDGYEPDPYAELPKDVYYIERKITENKSVLTYQLSSILDLEGTKIPKRIINADKCVWQYRGIGCWYQHAEMTTNANNEIVAENPVPLLEKAQLETINQDPLSPETGLPQNAPPVANDKNERLFPGENLQKWNIDIAYKLGNYVYLEKEKIKYYFVCVKENGQDLYENNEIKEKIDAIIPPNIQYWAADECSKTLTGCRLRWGDRKGKVNDKGCAIQKGELPFGGFPAARKISRLQ